MRHKNEPWEELPDDTRREFSILASALSPENLSCDGERSASEVRKRHADLVRKWNSLERRVGRPVSEDEVWRQPKRRTGRREAIR